MIPAMRYNDPSAEPGNTHQYRIVAASTVILRPN
jgi:hypothetical protein